MWYHYLVSVLLQPLAASEMILCVICLYDSCWPPHVNVSFVKAGTGPGTVTFCPQKLVLGT